MEEKIKNCEDTKEAAKELIVSHKTHIEEAERDLFRANNVQACLEASLKNLVDARDRGEDIAAIRPIPEEKKALEEIEEEGRSGKPHTLLKNKEKEKSAMEKIGEDVEEELTEEEMEKKNKALLNKADQQMVAAKKDQRSDWPKCPVCKIRPMAPWNKTGKCSYCQTYKKKKKDDLE